MKNKIILGLVSGAALLTFLPSVASAALTESQIQAILGLLQSFGADTAIVSNVNNSLRGLPTASTSAGSGTPAFCPNLTYNLYLGLGDSDTDGQVAQLQKFLAQDSSVFPEGAITGFYGPLTEQAVKRWQAKNSVVSSGSPDTTGYGVVGSKTREKMRATCSSVVTPISVSTEVIATPTPALPSKTIAVPETQAVSISEQVKCVFKGSTATQECISSSKYGYSCKGTESCTVDVKGFLKSEQLAWKSTCGGYVYTTMDEVNESAEFNCAATAQPAIQVISPNGGEQWSVGSTQTISWSGASSVGITLLAAPGTGLPSMDIGKVSNNQSFAWTIPAFISPGSYLIRVCTLVGADCAATDTSDAPFSIVAAIQPSITILSPNSVENWQVGSTQTIKWTMPSFKGRVYLQLLKGGAYIKDITYIDYYSVVDSSTQSYSWLISSDTATGSDYKIRVAIFSSAGNITDESDSTFNITALATQPSITALSPNQGTQGQTADVVITGSKLTGANNFSGSGISPISDRGFQLVLSQFVSDSQINAKFSITSDATTGVRNITVSTPNGTSNAMLFSILPAQQ